MNEPKEIQFIRALKTALVKIDKKLSKGRKLEPDEDKLLRRIRVLFEEEESED